MNINLKKALQEQKNSTQQAELEIQGSLGIPLNGQKIVDVPNRNSFVYVRLRDNQNEVVQAFNNKVAPSYDLPVMIRRQNNRYEVLSVNTARYQNNWNSYAPYLPKHGVVHSFYDGGGGDISWIYSRQFMPLLVYPGTGTNLMIAQHPILDVPSNRWKMVGGTGTSALSTYIPTGGSDAVMGLLYLDVLTGNPKLIINSGSPFPNFATGSSDIYSHLPVPSDLSTQIPLAGIRLVTGTATMEWQNLYDVRRFTPTIPTGTAGGGTPSVDTIGFAGLYNGVPLGTGTSMNVRSPSNQAIFTISGSMFDLFVTGSASGGPPSGNAGGDLTGSYPNPSVFQAHLSTQAAPASVATGTLILSAMDEQGFPAAHLYDVQGNMMDVLRDNLFVVRNVSGAGMTKGQVVYITGSTGQIPEVRLAKADSLGTLGQISVLYEDIGNNNYGRALLSGHLEHTNLSAFATGDELYVSPTVAGGLTATQPVNPNYSQIVGVVLNNGVGNGILQVYIRATTLTPVVTKVLVTGSMYMNYDGSQPGTGQVTLFISGSGVTGGDAHNHTGSTAQVSYPFLSNKPIAETNANDIFRCDNPGGVSLWTGTINGAPSGASVTVSAPTSGTEAVLVPVSTSQLAKMRLYNLTRGNYALISNYNTGTNVVTLTANAPANWVNGDSLTVVSQTVSGGGLNWVDLEITSALIGRLYIFVKGLINSATVGDALRTHPFSASFSTSKFTLIPGVSVANQQAIDFGLMAITSNVFSLAWTGTPLYIAIREQGYLE